MKTSAAVERWVARTFLMVGALGVFVLTALTVPRAEASAPLLLEFSSDASLTVEPSFTVTSNTLELVALPELNTIVGAKLTGAVTFESDVPQGDEIGEGNIDFFSVKVGVENGTLFGGGALIPGGTMIPVTWDYTIETAPGGSVFNEEVTFSASLPEEGNVSPTYSGDSRSDNRSGAGNLTFEGSLFPAGNGTYDMFLMLDWMPAIDGGQLTIDFGSDSLDINAIPEPSSAVMILFAGIVGVMMRRTRR
ncbi:MAG: hypothetical protein AAGD22_14645 [Verrucomicrobiota bacterium]